MGRVDRLLVVGVYEQVRDYGWDEVEENDGGDVVEGMSFPREEAF